MERSILYESETLTMQKKDIKRLEAFEIRRVLIQTIRDRQKRWGTY